MPIENRGLFLHAPQHRAIRDAIDNARVKTLSLQQVKALALGIPQDSATLMLADRPKGWSRPPAEEVLIEHGFRCCISFEQQPSGLCRHLSISLESETPQALPNHRSTWLLCVAFGLKVGPKFEGGKIWIEEYEPGKLAVNIVTPEPKAH